MNLCNIAGSVVFNAHEHSLMLEIEQVNGCNTSVSVARNVASYSSSPVEINVKVSFTLAVLLKCPKVCKENL